MLRERFKLSWKSAAVRYSLPVVTMLAALLAQGTLQHFLPKDSDFPFAFFYLVAAFVSAWFGGYMPGASACIIVMVGFPLAAVHFSQMPAACTTGFCASPMVQLRSSTGPRPGRPRVPVPLRRA